MHPKDHLATPRISLAAHPQTRSVLVHIVTFNHADVLEHTLVALDKTQGIKLEVVVTDNASLDQSAKIAERYATRVRSLPINIGFCGGQNSIVADFLASKHTHLCLLNPDVALAPNCLFELATRCEELATPKLMRGDAQLNLVSPVRIDAAGMIITSALRHFDRGSQGNDEARFAREEFVFGGTGACLMLSRVAVEKLLLPNTPHDSILEEIHPGILWGYFQRKKIFDEAFFAYREDAELAWRSQRLGLRCRYIPSAVGVHKRAVLPENRAELSAFINLLGVRNRFLLQLLHFSSRYKSAILQGFVYRNLLVVAGVYLRERSSIKAFSQLGKLYKRGKFLREWITTRATVSDLVVARWFKQESEQC